MTQLLDTQLPPIRVSKAFYNDLATLAAREQRPLSQLVRILIEDGVARRRTIVKARTPKQIAAAKRHARLVAEG